MLAKESKKGQPRSLVTMKDRKAMLEDYRARDYDDVVTTAMERLLGGMKPPYAVHAFSRNGVKERRLPSRPRPYTYTRWRSGHAHIHRIFNAFDTPRVLLTATIYCTGALKMAKSLSLKQNKSLMGQKTTSFQEGIYNKRALLPPGIRNSTNNCYANSILQCLCNNDVFRNACTAAGKFGDGM